MNLSERNRIVVASQSVINHEVNRRRKDILKAGLDPKDMEQECLCRLIQELDKVEAVDNPGAFARMVARTDLSNILKRETKLQGSTLPIADIPVESDRRRHSPAHDPKPFNPVDLVEDPRLKKLLQLKLAGYMYLEIYEFMGVTRRQGDGMVERAKREIVRRSRELEIEGEFKGI